jgi:hypothetical protein
MGKPLDLQSGTYLHEGFNSRPISANLSSATLPEGVLWRPCNRGGIRHLDSLRQHLPMQPDTIVLGTPVGRWGLHGPQGRLVHERSGEHRSGYRHPPTSHASDSDAPGLSGSEERVGDYVRTWGLVSLYLTIHMLCIDLPSNSVSMVSVIRLYSLHDIARSKDLSFDNPAHATLSAVEVNVAIICACLPAMRPLLALLMPKYFSAAAQYTNVPRKLDLDASWYRKDESKTFDTKTFDTSRSNTPRTNTASTNHISRGGTPQAPRPTLSRNSIGHFIVNNGRSRRPEEPRKIIPPWETYNHSRAGSNISIDIAAAEARSSKRVQSRVHPLRMSPVRADNPLSPTRMSMQSIGHGFFTFKRSDTLRVMNPDQVRRSEMRMSVKPLPLTPFPVGAAI